MGFWSTILSGGENYTTSEHSDGVDVRKNDGFTWSTGTKIGTADTMKEACDIIKSDSGGNDVSINRRG